MTGYSGGCQSDRNVRFADETIVSGPEANTRLICQFLPVTAVTDKKMTIDSGSLEMTSIEVPLVIKQRVFDISQAVLLHAHLSSHTS